MKLISVIFDTFVQIVRITLPWFIIVTGLVLLFRWGGIL